MYFEQAPGWAQEKIQRHFPSAEWENGAYVSKCESGWNPAAWKNDDVEDSRGWWQINVRAHPDALALDMFDAEVNIAYAAALWRTQGWRPWSCAGGLGEWVEPVPSYGSPPPPALSTGSPVLALVLVGFVLWWWLS